MYNPEVVGSNPTGTKLSLARGDSQISFKAMHFSLSVKLNIEEKDDQRRLYASISVKILLKQLYYSLSISVR